MHFRHRNLYSYYSGTTLSGMSVRDNGHRPCRTGAIMCTFHMPTNVSDVMCGSAAAPDVHREYVQRGVQQGYPPGTHISSYWSIVGRPSLAVGWPPFGRSLPVLAGFSSLLAKTGQTVPNLNDSNHCPTGVHPGVCRLSVVGGRSVFVVGCRCLLRVCRCRLRSGQCTEWQQTVYDGGAGAEVQRHLGSVGSCGGGAIVWHGIG